MKLNYFLKSKKGQAFESYRLLIAFVLALAMLIIIYSMIESINEKSIFLSSQKFKDGVISATKAAGISSKKVFIIEDLMLSGIISTRQLENYTGLAKECFYLEPGPGFKDTTSHTILEVQGNYKKMNVYTYCNFEGQSEDDMEDYRNQIYQTAPDCPQYCVLFFNKPPPINYE